MWSTLYRSRNQLAAQFQRQFNIAELPDAQQLSALLKECQLNVLQAPKADMVIVLIESEPMTQIFCLPPSRILPALFAEKLSGYMAEAVCPVVIYWPWQTNQDNLFTALRIKLLRTQNRITITTDAVYPQSIQFEADPSIELVHELEQRLPSYQIVFSSTLTGTLVGAGDKLYWISLSLLLTLAEEAKIYHQSASLWLKKMNANFTKRLLGIVNNFLAHVPYVHWPLFYVEQGLSIANTSVIKQQLSRFINAQFLLNAEDIPLRQLLRIGALGHIIYQRDFLTLGQLPFIYSLSLLSQRLLSTLPASLSKVILTFAFQTITVGLKTAFTLYALMPGNPTERAIISPRYWLDWCRTTLHELLQLLLKIPVLMVTVLSVEQLFGLNTETWDPADQHGFFAIIIVAIQWLLQWVANYFPQFESWEIRQNAEETVLQTLQQQCPHDCQFDIQSSLSQRVFQQATTNQQTLLFKATANIGDELKSVTNCTLKIEHDSAECTNYQLNCQSRFFREIKTVNASVYQALTTVAKPVETQDKTKLCRQATPKAH